MKGSEKQSEEEEELCAGGDVEETAVCEESPQWSKVESMRQGLGERCF